MRCNVEHPEDMNFLGHHGVCRLLHASLLAAAILALITYLIGGMSLGFWASTISFFALLGARWLVVRGHLHLGWYVMIVSLWCIASWLLTQAHGVRDGLIMLYPLLLMFTGLVLNRRFFWILAGATLLFLGGLGLAEEFGRFTTQYSEFPLGSDLYGILFTLGLLALCIDLIITSTRSKLQLIQESRVAIEKADRTKTEFLMMMSHELRSPLNPIIGFSTILQDQLSDPEQREYLDYIKQASARLQDLIEAVLEYSSLADGTVPMKPEGVAMVDFKDELECLVAPAAEQKGLEWGCTLQLPEDREADHLTLNFDRKRVLQVLRHLLANAVQFTERGRVDLDVEYTPSLDSDGGVLLCRITDTGPGIDANQAQEAFAPFQQLDMDILKRSESGLGLGLAVCDKLAGLLGGRLEYSRSAQGGSCFTCRFQVGE